MSYKVTELRICRAVIDGKPCHFAATSSFSSNTTHYCPICGNETEGPKARKIDSTEGVFAITGFSEVQLATVKKTSREVDIYLEELRQEGMECPTVATKHQISQICDELKHRKALKMKALGASDADFKEHQRELASKRDAEETKLRSRGMNEVDVQRKVGEFMQQQRSYVEAANLRYRSGARRGHFYGD